LVIKLGLGVKQSLFDIATSFNDAELHSSLKSPAILELAHYVKLKGCIKSLTSPLDMLCGVVLKKYISLPPPNMPGTWTPRYILQLRCEVDCIWQIYLAASSRDSTGLPLTQSQLEHHSYPVTLFHSDKPVAEGSIIWPHPTKLTVVDDDQGITRDINITATRSLINLTRVLVPNSIQAFHRQSVQWILDHGSQAVVTSSTIRSRSLDVDDTTSSINPALSSPAPPSYTITEENITDLALSLPSVTEPPHVADDAVNSIEMVNLDDDLGLVDDDDMDTDSEDNDPENLVSELYSSVGLSHKF
jgi:hypothetical protein